VIRSPHDTVRFEAPASARPCGRPAPGGVVLHGATGGNGVLLWLRSPDSLAGDTWPLVQRADTVTRRGAIVALRFMIGDVAHGVALDSGAVSLTRGRGEGGRSSALTATIRASGLEATTAGRVAVEASFESVPLARDTVSCLARP